MTARGQHRAGLADFLKTRRARLHPEQFDLPMAGRRRTPGLRREELAQLVGMGVSWYTWLEQGRAIQVSDQVLSRLAAILQLNEEERRHLFCLAGHSIPGSWQPGTERLTQPAISQGMLDAFSYPAHLVDRHLTIVAWNESANRVFGEYTTRSPRERNIVWFAFTHPLARALFANWEQAARATMALLRARSDYYADDAWFAELIADLQRSSSEFRAWWPEHEILSTCRTPTILNHPQVGRLAFQARVLVEPSQPDVRLGLHLPLSQEDTPVKLKALMTKDEQGRLSS